MPSAWKGIVAGLAVVIPAFAICFYIFYDRGESPQPKSERKEPGRIATAKTTIRRAPKPIEANTGNPKLDEKLKKAGQFDRTVEVEVAAADTPPEEFIAKAKQTKRVFSTGVEQLMSIMFTCKPGNMPFPLVQIPDADYENLAAILITKNEIDEDDTEDIKRCKETVMEVKKEMMSYIRQGGDPDDFMAYYHAKLLKDFEYRNEAMRLAQESYEEDPALGRAFVEKINAQLGEEGILPLSMSDVSPDEESDEESEVYNDGNN